MQLLQQGAGRDLRRRLGFCSVIRAARDGSASIELAALYVGPARWRRGVGRALAEAALPPHQDASLWVFAANERARRFYRELGFAEDGAQAVDPGTGVLEIRMWRPGTPLAAAPRPA